MIAHKAVLNKDNEQATRTCCLINRPKCISQAKPAACSWAISNPERLSSVVMILKKLQKDKTNHLRKATLR